jgi:hypothetical protein
MRVIIPLLSLVVQSNASARLNELSLLAFVSVECTALEGEPERTTLPEIISPREYKLLLAWFLLDEDTFVERAKETVGEVHQICLAREDDGPLLRRNLVPLQNAGLTEEEILDTLTRKYHRALRKITALQDLAAKGK